MSARSYSSLNQNRALTTEDLMVMAPSIFATTAHESRSERYTVIPTGEIVSAMRREGFVPFSAKQSKTRDESRRDFTKHMIRFRHESAMGRSIEARKVGDTYPEVVLVNSNDGTSAYDLRSALMRLICTNGMLTSDGFGAAVKVAHKGDILRKVIEGSYEVLDDSRRALDAAEGWAGLRLNRDEEEALAEQAHFLRFSDAEGNVTTPIAPRQLLTARRHEDRNDPSLWNAFNRIQENVIRGGLTAMGRTEDGRVRRSTTREVNGIDADTKLNKALWALTQRMAELKGAA